MLELVFDAGAGAVGRVAMSAVLLLVDVAGAAALESVNKGRLSSSVVP